MRSAPAAPSSARRRSSDRGGRRHPSAAIRTESWLGVPILAGDRVHRRRSALESLEQNAYHEADERLLTTLAASMGVALENARLFDETKRLLTETNERAAELAIINSVQQGLAAQLDMQAMYDLVGDKIREIFDAQVVDIGVYDDDAERSSASRTPSSAACASPTSRCAIGFGRAGRRDERRRSWSIDDIDGDGRERGQPAHRPGRAAEVGRCSRRSSSAARSAA